MRALGTFLAVLFVAWLVFVGVKSGLTAYCNNNDANWCPAVVQPAPEAEDASKADPVAVDMPDLDPVPGTASADSTPEPAQEGPTTVVEIDQTQDISREGWGNGSFRFQDLSGDTATAALRVEQEGVLAKLAFVCDDVCYQILLVREDGTTKDLTSEFQVYVPNGTDPEDHYMDWKPSTAITDDSDIGQYVGLKVDDTLTGWAAPDLDLAMTPGDRIIVVAKDDDSLNVEVGVTAFFFFRPSEQ